ncbi:hypothetical protein [Fibrella forsythiae]|uniref:Uncharacterized protein n=1 Tax=Fibrella forsythiae TaxID=2817061 RepID=A0ABS3JTA7_9BACT|nr:hypothetical protein [Fibrella forsythiae]MBO0953242.1 hypothetical protein [Fibrella forsythiae]
MAKETSLLQVRMSPRLKQQFKQVCEENEIDMSDKVREIIANLVRSHRRPSAKTGKTDD